MFLRAKKFVQFGEKCYFCADMAKITATVITFNEQARVAACLESLRDVADEIIVIDSFSTDATVDICRQAGAQVRQRKFTGFGAQRQYATSLASHPYVLSIDADEVLSPALRESLIALKSTGFTHRVYCMRRLNFYCGRPVRHCGWYPDVQVRLFDKRYANWNLRDVSEEVIFRDSVRPEMVDGDILHYRCDSPEQYHAVEEHHAELRSHVIAAHATGVPPLKPVFAGIGAFLECYIGQGGILDGAPGRAISVERFRCARLSYALARKEINGVMSD